MARLFSIFLFIVIFAGTSFMANAQVLQVTSIQKKYNNTTLIVTFETNSDIRMYTTSRLSYQIKPETGLSTPDLKYSNDLNADKTKLVFNIPLSANSQSVALTLHISNGDADVLQISLAEDTTPIAALADKQQKIDLQAATIASLNTRVSQLQTDNTTAQDTITNQKRTIDVLTTQIEATMINYTSDFKFVSDDTIIVWFQTDQNCKVQCTCTNAEDGGMKPPQEDADLTKLHKFKFTRLIPDQPYKFSAQVYSNITRGQKLPLTASKKGDGTDIQFRTEKLLNKPEINATATPLPLGINLAVAPTQACEAAITIQEITDIPHGTLGNPVKISFPDTLTPDSNGSLHGVALTNQHFDVPHASRYRITVYAVNPSTQKLAATFTTDVDARDKPTPLAFKGAITVNIDAVAGTTLKWETTVAPKSAKLLLRLKDANGTVLDADISENAIKSGSSTTSLSATLPVAKIIGAFSQQNAKSAQFVVQASDDISTPIEQALEVNLVLPTQATARSVANTNPLKADINQVANGLQRSKPRWWESLLQIGLGILLPNFGRTTY